MTGSTSSPRSRPWPRNSATGLAYILEDARAIEKKDAAVNALNIIFSLNSLSADYLKEYYQDFLDNIATLQATT